jgi:hypothetical protein
MVAIRLTPVDTRKEGFPRATGVTRNATNPGNPGFFFVGMLYEAAALTGLSYAAKDCLAPVHNSTAIPRHAKPYAEFTFIPPRRIRSCLNFLCPRQRDAIN